MIKKDLYKRPVKRYFNADNSPKDKIFWQAMKWEDQLESLLKGSNYKGAEFAMNRANELWVQYAKS